MAVSDFAMQLKQGTKKSHTMAENTGFVRQFLKGVVDEMNYRQLVANFYFIYQALESEMENLKDDPYVGPLRLNGLARKDALIKDLEWYYGDNWKDTIRPTEQAQRYVARIHEVAHESPRLLVGHHYTRYMGDLSGGQILKGIAKNAMGLQDRGLDFYEFPEITDKKGFKESYRSVLNDWLPCDQADVDAIIVEANYAFRLNMYMFDEIDGDAGKSLWQLFKQGLLHVLGELIISKRYR